MGIFVPSLLGKNTCFCSNLSASKSFTEICLKTCKDNAKRKVNNFQGRIPQMLVVFNSQLEEGSLSHLGLVGVPWHITSVDDTRSQKRHELIENLKQKIEMCSTPVNIHGIDTKWKVFSVCFWPHCPFSFQNNWRCFQCQVEAVPFCFPSSSHARITDSETQKWNNNQNAKMTTQDRY